MDLVAATGVVMTGTKHTESTRFDLVKNAFSATIRILAAHAGEESALFSCEVGRLPPFAPWHS